MLQCSTARWFVGIASLAGLCLCAAYAGAIEQEKKPADSLPAMGESMGQQELPAEAPGAKLRPEQARPEPRAPRATPAERIAEEERKHLRRMVRINRIQTIGIETANQALVELARELRDKETQRHELALRRLERELNDPAAGRGGDR